MRFEAPGEREAGERAWEVVRTAYETREPVAWPRRNARPLVAAAAVTAVVAAAVSPPGRSVIHSLRKAVGVENAQPELFSLPAPGRLLVSGPGGAWIVNRDGSRRRLGPYRDASWSPTGIFVAATGPNEVVALDRKGNVRWTLPRRSPRFPTWTGTRTDTRIAYLSGGRLRIVAGDGTGDRAIAPASLVAPAWRPLGASAHRTLAFVDAIGRIRVIDADRGRTLWQAPGGPDGVRGLAWSYDGSRLLARGASSLRVFAAAGRLRTDFPTKGTSLSAAFAPESHRLAFVLGPIAGATGRSIVLLADADRLRASVRPIFSGTGRMRDLTWSPDGRWFVVTWPTANQWVFVRNAPRLLVGASRISTQFGSFPRVAGWCCAR